MIRLEGINKTYEDGFVAIKNLNLEFVENGINVLIGPSGCGKTTTMKLINRLIRPSKGKIYIQGEDISKQDPVELRRQIGYVIQNVGLFPHMTIGKNVAVVPKLLKWDENKINQRVDELMRMVNLDPDTFKDRYPAELSGGQQQRIGVIRALAAEPNIILMDEPFSALDPISREQLQDELIRLQNELKKTIVFVTHDMDEAIKIADMIIIMKDGEIVQKGTPEQILRHPTNDFVKSFVGEKRLHDDLFDQIPTVDEVMANHPVTAFPTRGLAEAIKMMQRHKVDSLVIVDKNNELKGHASIFQVLDRFREEETTLSQVMKPFEHVIPSGTSLSVALSLMDEHRLPYLPVVKEDNKFVGLITRGSLVKHMADVYTPNPSTEGETEG